MNNFGLAMVVASSLGLGTACGAFAAGQGGAQSKAAEVPSSPFFEAELTKSLDAKKAKVGDPVNAKVTAESKSNGKIVFPQGTKLVGHITEVQARTKDETESRLGIAFDKAILKNGGEVAFNEVIHTLISPPRPAVRMPDISNSSLNSSMDRAGGLQPSGNAHDTTPHALNEPIWSQTAQRPAPGARQTGVDGLYLKAPATDPGHSVVITSSTGNVKLDSGTRLVFQLNTPAR
ncbi:MAG: hypothetical protein LAO20_04115 [Acidobacteriia bacterium]|nr:hypothetical protein [Terriglobia bacterium]